LVVLAVVAVVGAASGGGAGPEEPQEAGTAGVQAVPGVSARAFEGRLAASGWQLTFRHEALGRRGQGTGRGLAVEVAERGEGSPLGMLTGVTCRATAAGGSAGAEALDFLDACVPSDALDPVHHWMVGRWAAHASSSVLVLGERVFRLSAESGGARDLSVDAR
jgi:hypothetical protein